MKTEILTFIVGLVVGVGCGMLKLPIPAPPTLAGVLGIIGITLGFFVVNYFRPL